MRFTLKDPPITGTLIQVSNTNQHKDVIAQRDISASEARQRVKGIVILRSSSLTQHMKR